MTEHYNAVPVNPYAATATAPPPVARPTVDDRVEMLYTLSDNQRIVLSEVSAGMRRGATWAEIAELTGLHHGVVSGALSVLHREGKVSRLSLRRGRCKIYVTPHYVDGRPTEQQGRPSKVCPHCGGDL